MNLTEFLNKCKESGNQAYYEFKNLLKKLEDPLTRKETRQFLSSVENYLNKLNLTSNQYMSTYNFRIHQLCLSGINGDDVGSNQKRQTLTLLEMSSIFIPEDWSFTFYEGITRHPVTGYHDRLICELGCGNGWVSIAMAERWLPKKMYGLDINPRAINVACINLYMNALYADGMPIIDEEGKTLLDRVEFYQSDLLQYINENKIVLDRVIGCIPQILSPDPEASLQIASENMSEEYLHSLSNYCGLQGYVEDQFGLGLIARAVEEAIEVLKPSGVLILNMGGRPGEGVCERLFKRRGFGINKLWQTKVNQAADTDIVALVDIERSSRHRFEFFMGATSDQPICARTAYAYAKAGGMIAHKLTVYECRLQFPSNVKRIFKFLQQDGYESTRSAIDLSFTNEAVADEKITFLSHLAHNIYTNAHSKIEPIAGNERFRSQIASFFRLYFRAPIFLENVVVMPSRKITIVSLLRMYSSKLTLVDSSLTKYLPNEWLNSFPIQNLEELNSHNQSNPMVIESPSHSDLLINLAKTLNPKIIITSLSSFEMHTATAFKQLVDVSSQVKSRLFLDISENLELSSLPQSNGVLQYLAENDLPEHVAIICGLVKNQVYNDLEVCFTLSKNETFLNALSISGNLTYDRTPSMNQLYYGCLFHELLNFQIPDRHSLSHKLPKKESQHTKSNFVQLIPTISELVQTSSECIPNADSDFQNPESQTIYKNDPVFMNYCQNVLPQTAVNTFVFESFCRQNISEAEIDLTPELSKLVQNRFGLSIDPSHPIILGDGSAPLFFHIMLSAKKEKEKEKEDDDDVIIFFPFSASKHFISTANYCGNETKIIPTHVEDEFKLNFKALEENITRCKNPWLVLSYPVVSTTGAIYSNEEIRQIIATCQKFGVRLILDACFAGLENEPQVREAMQLETYLSVNPDQIHPNFAFALLGSISNQFSTRGLRFGYAIFRHPVFMHAFREGNSLSRPHGTLRYAVKKLLNAYNEGEESMAAELLHQKSILKTRADQLVHVLSECGWHPIPPKGGLSLVAKPAAYEGKVFTYLAVLTESAADPPPHAPNPLPNLHLSEPVPADLSVHKTTAGTIPKTVVLNSENIVEALYDMTGLLINGSSGINLPGYCRFVIAIEESEFLKALDCVRHFHKLVLG